MDTSKDYILMCDEAIPVQKGWKIQEGDHYSTMFSTGIVNSTTIHYFPQYGERNFTWLPRQDQIQNMIQKADVILLQKFVDWILTNWAIDISYTYEQLWLMYYMEIKQEMEWNVKKKKWTTL